MIGAPEGLGAKERKGVERAWVVGEMVGELGIRFYGYMREGAGTGAPSAGSALKRRHDQGTPSLVHRSPNLR